MPILVISGHRGTLYHVLFEYLEQLPLYGLSRRILKSIAWFECFKKYNLNPQCSGWRHFLLCFSKYHLSTFNLIFSRFIFHEHVHSSWHESPVTRFSPETTTHAYDRLVCGTTIFSVGAKMAMILHRRTDYCKFCRLYYSIHRESAVNEKADNACASRAPMTVVFKRIISYSIISIAVI